MDKELSQQIREIVAESSLCHTSMANRGECEQEIDELASAILKLFKERMLRLIGLYEEYIALLGKELDETASMAYVHGWKSSRHEQGKKMREKIAELRNAINTEGKR
jgi:hypothetical protein